MRSSGVKPNGRSRGGETRAPLRIGSPGSKHNRGGRRALPASILVLGRTASASKRFRRSFSGKDMADDLGATVNSVVLVTSPQGELTPFGIVPKYMRFKVVGIFQSGFYDYDSAWAMTDLADSQRLFGLGDLVSVLEFKIDDIYKAGDVGENCRKRRERASMATNWMEQNRALFRACAWSASSR